MVICDVHLMYVMYVYMRCASIGVCIDDDASVRVNEGVDMLILISFPPLRCVEE
jgi:hypothetical protein